MRKVNIRTLRSDLSKHLEDLPFAITKHGELIAVVTDPVKFVEEEPVGFCKHNAAKGLCKKGCK